DFHGGATPRQSGQALQASFGTAASGRSAACDAQTSPRLAVERRAGMKIPSNIESQAAEWLVRRDRAETPQQRQAFEQWLAADARHRYAYLQLQNSWQHADGLKTWIPHRGRVNPK